MPTRNNRPRNPVVRAGAILRKGGAHVKSVSGQRQRERSQLHDEVDEWLSDDVDAYKEDRGGDQPPSAALVRQIPSTTLSAIATPRHHTFM